MVPVVVPAGGLPFVNDGASLFDFGRFLRLGDPEPELEIVFDQFDLLLEVLELGSADGLGSRSG